MRAFVFVAAGAHYAVEASSIQAVHPLVRAQPIPGAPPWLAGVIDVHGELVPMVDACALLAGVRSGDPTAGVGGTGATTSPPPRVAHTLGARVVLVDTGIEAGRTRARFALAVDRVLDPVDLDMDTAWHGGSSSLPWLGSVVQLQDAAAAQLFDPVAFAKLHRQLTPPPATEVRRVSTSESLPGTSPPELAGGAPS